MTAGNTTGSASARPWHVGRENRIVAGVIGGIVVVVLVLVVPPYLQPPPPSYPIHLITWVIYDRPEPSVFTGNLQWPVDLQLNQTFHMYGNITDAGPVNSTLLNFSISSPFTLLSYLPSTPVPVIVDSAVSFELTLRSPTTAGSHEVNVTAYFG